MRRACLFLSLLMLAVTAASSASANSNATGSAVNVAAELEARRTAVDQREALADRREAELANKEAIREARSQLEDASHSRLEILIAAFGILITVVIVFFALNTAAGAREAARKEIAEEKSNIERIVSEATQHLEAIKTHGTEATKHLEVIKETGSEARSILDGMKSGEPPQPPDERRTIEASQKPASERSIEDLKALIDTSRLAGDWPAMREHAQALLYLYGHDLAAVRKARFNLAYALDEFGNYDDAIAELDKLIATYSEAVEPQDDERRLASAMYNKGIALGHLGKSEEAIALYDAMIERFDNRDDPALRRQVANAMLSKGYRLGVLGKSAEAISVYDELVRRFEGEEDLALLVPVAKAMVNRSVRLGLLGKNAEAVAANDQIINRFEHNTEPDLLEQSALAMVNKGLRLRAMGSTSASIAAFEDAINRFGESTQTVIQKQVEKALYMLASAYARQADIDPAIANLRRWSSHRSGFDCGKVAGDKDFDPVREDSRFVALLLEMGCSSE